MPVERRLRLNLALVSFALWVHHKGNQAQVNRLVTYPFLRLYGRALSRSQRNDPETACRDALMQTAMFVTVPIMSTCWVLAVLIWPEFSDHLTRFDGEFLVPTIGGALLVTYGVTRVCKKYPATLAAVEAYRAPNARRVTWAVFLAVPILWLVLAGAALRVLKAHV